MKSVTRALKLDATARNHLSSCSYPVGSVVLGAFALVALALAIVGAYGVMSHAVTQRTREIGIRIAIGPAPSQVLAAVLRQSLTVTGIGAAIGILGRIAGSLPASAPREPRRSARRTAARLTGSG